MIVSNDGTNTTITKNLEILFFMLSISFVLGISCINKELNKLIKVADSKNIIIKKNGLVLIRKLYALLVFIQKFQPVSRFDLEVNIIAHRIPPHTIKKVLNNGLIHIESEISN